MSSTRKPLAWRTFGKPAIAGLLTLLLLLSAFASHSEALHEWLHTDHASSTHHCLVTVLERGQSDAPEATVFVEPQASEHVSAWAPREVSFRSLDYFLHPERGPPVRS